MSDIEVLITAIEVARLFLVHDYMHPTIVFKCGETHIVSVHGGVDSIRKVKEAIEKLKPEWIAVISTPKLSGKNCLYIEVTIGDRKFSKLYDIIGDGEDYEFEEIDGEYVFEEITNTCIGSQQNRYRI